MTLPSITPPPLVALTSVCVMALLATAPAAVTLPPVFSDGMVLQQSEKTPVWGTANPGENVFVEIGQVQGKAQADASGHWMARLNLKDIGYGPFEMSVSGENRLTVKDILIGDVWFCSGQSNMDFKLDRILNPKQEIEASTDPWLREFRIGWKASPTPLDAYTGRWIQASPATSAQFSAVAYFFGKNLRGKLERPIGFLHSSWGGTMVEAWISQIGAAKNPTLAAHSKELNAEAGTFPTRRAEYAKAVRAWEEQHGIKLGKTTPEEIQRNASLEADLSAWQELKIVGNQANKLSDPLEVLWLRRTIDLPAGMAGKKVSLLINNIHQFADIYWNGRRIGTINPATYTGFESSSLQDARHYFSIPEGDIQPTGNTLAIRLYSLNGQSIIGPGHFCLESPSERFYLDGNWQSLRQPAPENAQDLVATVPAPVAAPTQPHNIASNLYNGMVHPLVPYGITGFLWYQGEANVGRAAEYRVDFPLLITDWREQWKDPALPFYFCQLPNFGAKTSAPGKSAWAELRDAQDAALALPQTGRVVIIDVGEAEDIHPRDKKTVGDRLAALALAKTYGSKDTFAGPEFQSAHFEGSKVTVKFSSEGDSLEATDLPAEHVLQSLPLRKAALKPNSPESQLQGFEVAGADGHWAFANARIEGSEVIVESASVPQPVAVRYAWADNPTINLINKAGYPAAPFCYPPFPPKAAQ